MSLNFITCESVADKLLAPGREKVLVIDVRDEDYEGGHIIGCCWRPCR